MPRSERLAFKVDNKIKQKFQQVCQENGLSMSEVGRRAIVNQIKELKSEKQSD